MPNSGPRTSPPRPPEPGPNSSTRAPRSAARARSINPSQALAAARAYLDAVPDVTGTAHLAGANALVVDTTTTYRTTFLGLIGINALTVTGHAQAQITRAVGGAAQ